MDGKGEPSDEQPSQAQRSSSSQAGGSGRTPGGAAPRERLAHPSAAGKSGAEGTVMLCTSHVEAAGTLIMNLMDFGGQKPGGRGLGVSDLRGVLLRDEGQLHAV